MARKTPTVAPAAPAPPVAPRPPLTRPQVAGRYEARFADGLADVRKVLATEVTGFRERISQTFAGVPSAAAAFLSAITWNADDLASATGRAEVWEEALAAWQGDDASRPVPSERYEDFDFALAPDGGAAYAASSADRFRAVRNWAESQVTAFLRSPSFDNRTAAEFVNAVSVHKLAGRARGLGEVRSLAARGLERILEAPAAVPAPGPIDDRLA